jgi:hypothetical protein
MSKLKQAAVCFLTAGLTVAGGAKSLLAGEKEYLGVETRPPAAASVPADAKDRDRYRYENGRWWYQLPNGRMVLWSGKEWIGKQAAPHITPPAWQPRAGFDPTFRSDLDVRQARLAEEQAPSSSLSVLDAARSARTPTFPEPGYVEDFWLRRYNYNFGGYGPGPGAFSSPFYRHSVFPAPVGPFNYGSFGPYLGGGLTGGMANGFLGRWP